ncbi:unnamed protein product [Cylicocyclus nassatus]|uniref:Uncharacterized protein n=1 Tax=Cylicocyclus nassatus TaxID=53992 RepID=A0AA36GG04_CYLNA|nr:unnamed protein product [Cylicocyclus nassatus]
MSYDALTSHRPEPGADNLRWGQKIIEDASQRPASGQSSSFSKENASVEPPLSRRASTANVDALSLQNASEDSIDLLGRTFAVRLKEFPPDIAYEKLSQIMKILFKP